MLQAQQGRGGLCLRFAENDDQEEPKLIQIRLKHEAPDDLVETCGLPSNKAVGLKVSPISGCQGFEATPQA